MKKCPVCNAQVEDLYTDLCPNPGCTWEFELIAAEPMPEMQKRYEEKLRRARASYERGKQVPQDTGKKETPTVQTEGDIFTDPRDGETYKTITLEDSLKCTKVMWLAENLRFKTENSWAYDNDEGYVKILGRLYTWDAAKQACPPGWRLPSERDWDLLIQSFGGGGACHAFKSTKGWYGNGNGDNKSGFTALPGGIRDNNGSFGSIGYFGYWWSAAENGARCAWSRGMNYHTGNQQRSSSNKELGISVRCVRDF